MPSTPNQEFSPENLNWMRRWKSQSHLISRKTNKHPSSKEEWEELLKSISADVSADKFLFDGMHSATIKKGVVLTTKFIEEALVLRKINDNVRRSYSIYQPNRQTLINIASQAIRENCKKSIIRVDIKKCYESINRGRVIEKLRSDRLVSYQTMTLIDQLFSRIASLKPKITASGLPRGIILSSTLAEIKLRELDSAIRRIPGVYLLLRYVDDLLIFSSDHENETLTRVLDISKEEGLLLNKSKTRPYRISCACEKTCIHQKCPCKSKCTCHTNKPYSIASIEYLGYKFALSNHNKEDAKKPNDVYRLLSDRKIARIKTRIHKSFYDFNKHGNFPLLCKRIKYLSGNQSVRKSPSNRQLFSGLAYTHSDYSSNIPANYASLNGNKIESIDRFLQTLIRKSTSLEQEQKEEIKKISFKSGFTHFRRTKFTGSEVKEIRRCWIYG